MNWDKLDLHLENLIPGLSAFAALEYGWPTLVSRIGDSVLWATALVGLAYTVGVVVNVMSRMLFDKVSEDRARRPVFVRFGWRKIRDVEGVERDAIKRMSATEIHDLYNRAGHAVRMPGNEETLKEVNKRRQTGRLLRTAFPVCAILMTGLVAKASWPWLVRLVALLAGLAVAYAALLFLYAYAELTIFHESYHALKRQKAEEPSDAA